MIQGADDEIGHVQPSGAVTEALPTPPAARKDIVVTEAANVHGAPACWTVTTLPAMMAVPVLAADDGLAGTEIRTACEPTPPAMFVVAQLVPLPADHWQEAPDVTDTLT